MPKSSSERSSKSEFSDSEFVFGGVKFNGGIDKGDAGGERDGDLGGHGNVGGGEGGGEGDMGGDGDLVCGDCDVEGRGDGDLGGGDLCLFCQARRVPGESGGGIGIAGELGGCGEGDLGGGDLCLFRQARTVLGESGGGTGIAGETARCTVSVFFLLTFI